MFGLLTSCSLPQKCHMMLVWHPVSWFLQVGRRMKPPVGQCFYCGLRPRCVTACRPPHLSLQSCGHVSRSLLPPLSNDSICCWLGRSQNHPVWEQQKPSLDKGGSRDPETCPQDCKPGAYMLSHTWDAVLYNRSPQNNGAIDRGPPLTLEVAYNIVHSCANSLLGLHGHQYNTKEK